MTTIHVGAEPAKPEGYADFLDGRSAKIQRVKFEILEAADSLVITPPEAKAEIWRISELREVPDQADAKRLVLTSTKRGLARLTLTDDTSITVLRSRARKLQAKPPVRGKWRVLGWAGAAVASVFVIVFFLVPVMADQLARFIPPEGERALGEKTLEQIQTALGNDFLPIDFCTEPKGTAALRKMQDRLQHDDLGLPYPVTISVLDHPMVNAFALPGGQVVFFSGMIDAADNPDEIAAVMAHEIGHVVARDPTRIALRSAGSLGVIGLLLGDFAGGAAVLYMVEQLIQADYSQEAEAAADEFGIEMLIHANVDPGALGTLFEKLREEYGDTSGFAEHFATHPSLGDRIEVSRAAGSRLPDPTPSLNEDDWQALKGVCGSWRSETIDGDALLPDG